MELEYSFTEQELIDETRRSLANLDESKIPDETITQTADMFIVPLLNDLKNFDEEEQDSFDNAVVAWTAEMSFNSWLTFTRLRDREIETFIDPKAYKEGLENKTNMALRILGLTRPSDIPNHVVTIKHDGVKRKANYKQERVFSSHRSEGSE